MSRSVRPLELSRGKPTGPRWAAYRKMLFRRWGNRPCWYCHEPIAPGMGEVEHRISWRRRPDLAWQEFCPDGEPNLVPVHGAGRKRSPSGLACNLIAASNTVARDEMGRPLPFSTEYIAEKVSERRAFLASGRAGKQFPRNPPAPAADLPPRKLISPFHGRDW